MIVKLYFKHLIGEETIILTFQGRRSVYFNIRNKDIVIQASPRDASVI